MAADTARGYTITYVKAPLLNLIKNVTKVHGSSKPGDTLQYVVQYQNTGSGYANTVVITDLVPTNTAYVPGSTYTSPDSSAWTSISDASAGNPSGGTLTYNFGTVNGGYFGQVNGSTQGWIKFRVVIN